MADAIKKVMEAQQAAAPAPGAAAPGAPGAPPGPVPQEAGAQADQLALQKGGGQAGAPTEPKLQGPPITSILVRPTQ
jgi:hypothetical protein